VLLRLPHLPLLPLLVQQLVLLRLPLLGELSLPVLLLQLV
jgi:hypothetical protein